MFFGGLPAHHGPSQRIMMYAESVTVGGRLSSVLLANRNGHTNRFFIAISWGRLSGQTWPHRKQVQSIHTPRQTDRARLRVDAVPPRVRRILAVIRVVVRA